MTSLREPTTGVFGGSFDPIHLGHLLLARDVLEAIPLRRILFVPAHQAPLRANQPMASGQDRSDMILSATANEPRFDVSELEINATEVNYTIDTVEKLVGVFPEERFALIVGADQLMKLPQWKRVEELVELTDFICLERPGYELASLPRLELNCLSIKSRSIQVSSSEIRERLQKGLSVEYMIPNPVLEMIQARRLYGVQPIESH